MLRGSVPSQEREVLVGQVGMMDSHIPAIASVALVHRHVPLAEPMPDCRLDRRDNVVLYRELVTQNLESQSGVD